MGEVINVYSVDPAVTPCMVAISRGVGLSSPSSGAMYSGCRGGYIRDRICVCCNRDYPAFLWWSSDCSCSYRYGADKYSYYDSLITRRTVRGWFE